MFWMFALFMLQWISVQSSGYLFVCIAACRLCLEKREKKREVLEEGRAGLSFIFSAWILQKVISHNNRISALFARHIFPSGLWSVPPSVRSLNSFCHCYKHAIPSVWGCVGNTQLSFSLFLCNNGIRSPKTRTPLQRLPWMSAGPLISKCRLLGLTSYPMHSKM